MEDNCSIKPGNFKEFIKSSWFIKPLQGIAIGSILGLLLYFLLGNGNSTNNIYGDILAGIVIGFFFINIPCLACNSGKEQ
jgi:hypothetical protein